MTVKKVMESQIGYEFDENLLSQLDGKRIFLTDLKISNMESVTGVPFQSNLKLQPRRERGQFVSHADFVKELFELVISRAPDGSIYRPPFYKDSTGARFEAYATNNWPVHMYVTVPTLKSPGKISYAIYYRKSKEEVKNSVYEEISRIYPAAQKQANILRITLNGGKGYKDYPTSDELEEIATGFWEFVEKVSDVNLEAVELGPNENITSKVNVPRYYLGVATIICAASRFGLKHMLPRGGGESARKTFDMVDEIIEIGATKNALKLFDSKNGWRVKGIWREHAVPCKYIIDKAIQMIECNSMADPNARNERQLIIDIARMLKRNLTLVYCTNEEAKKIDKKYRTSMPEGWDSLNGSVLARFYEVGIPVYNFDGKKYEDDICSWK